MSDYDLSERTLPSVETIRQHTDNTATIDTMRYHYTLHPRNVTVIAESRQGMAVIELTICRLCSR